VVLLVIAAAVAVYEATSPTGTPTTVTSTIGGSGAAQTVTVTSTLGALTSSVGSSQLQDLISLAKAEGTVSVVTLAPAATFQNFFIKGFQQAFPWAQVTFTAASSAQAYTLALQGYQANKVTNDIYQETDSNMVPLHQQGIIATWCNPILSAMGYTADATIYAPGSDCYSTPYQDYPVVLAYNTNLVKDPSTLPKSWLDLANSQYKGEIGTQSIGPGQLSTSIFAKIKSVYNMSDSAWATYIQNLAPNLVTSSTFNNVFASMQAGNVPYAMAGLNAIVPAIVQGGPIKIDWMPISWSSYQYQGIATNAPHPYMAELWLMWLASYQSQELQIQANYFPGLTALIPKTFSNYPIPTNTTFVNITPQNWDGNATTQAPYMRVFNATFPSG
jgi:ABC-type Fe3+ transport system substrate-binding protein